MKPDVSLCPTDLTQKESMGVEKSKLAEVLIFQIVDGPGPTKVH